MKIRTWVGVVVCAALLATTLVMSLMGGDQETSPTGTPSATTPSEPSRSTSQQTRPAPSRPTSTSSTETMSTRSATNRGERSRSGDDAGVPESEAGTSAPRGAVDAAVRFTELVERHQGSTQGQWWSAVKPVLSDLGQTQLQGRPVQAVPFARRTGPAKAMAGDPVGEGFVSVGVPTDEGPYVVLVEEAGGHWKVASVSQLGGS